MEGVGIVLCLRDTGMSLSEIKHCINLCKEGIYTLPERLEIIQDQKRKAYEELAEFQKKVDHLEAKRSMQRRISGSRWPESRARRS